MCCGERSVLRVPARDLALSDRERRQPATVEHPAAPPPAFALALSGRVGVDDVTGDRKVLVDGLAGDQQVHDLGRAFEDAVDPQVAQQLLDPIAFSPRAASESAVS